MSGHHVPRKRFGQNFLADRGVIARIVAAIDPRPGDRIVEIGPGLGALTGPLLERVPHLDVVEIDRDLADRLEAEYPPERLTVHRADALEFDLPSLGAPLRVVGNLPYNISTPLLFRFAAVAESVRDLHLMLQREVVDRMAAAPGTAEYGRLSVTVQYRFEVVRLLRVGSGAFRPAPKVESAVVRLVPRGAGAPRAADEHLFARIVSAGFGQRRKTLRNTLREWLAEEDYARLALDPGLRAETLDVARFVAISDYVTRRDAAEGVSASSG